MRTVIFSYIKNVVRFAVNTLARFKGMNFPKKYDWDWKIRMLFLFYEKDTTALVKKIIKPGMIAIDAGAHIGYYSRIFSKLVGKSGRVYAFEPEEENFKILKKNTKTLRNVKIIKKALSDKEGIIDFYRAEGYTGFHSILPLKVRQNKIEVFSDTFDGFIKNENIKNIDIIKIDIEGGEPYAFLGGEKLLAQPNLMIIMEFNLSNFLDADPNQFLLNFINKGFFIYKITRGGDIELINFPRLDIKKLINGEESVNLFLKK